MKRSLFLFFTLLSLTFAGFPLVPVPASGQTVVQTSVSMASKPNPVGVGQLVSVEFQVAPAPPLSDRFHNLTVTVLCPDGRQYTLGPFISSQTGATTTWFTPDQVGTHNVSVNYPGETFNGQIFAASESQTIGLVVQAEPVETSPIPTPTPTIPPSEATDTIIVGNSPKGIAYDSGKNEIFVANCGSNTVSVISDVTNIVVATIPVGKLPVALAYDSGKGEVFVANSGSNTVSVISDTINTIVANVTVGNYPLGLAYDSGKGEIFVANSGSDTVSVISDVTNTVVATINVSVWNDVNANGIAYDSGNGEIFVANDPLSYTVSVISDSTNMVVATIDVGFNPVGVAYDSGKGEIYVACAGTNHNTVSVISDDTNAVVSIIHVRFNPYGLAYNSGKSEIYVGSTGTTVSVISDKTHAVIANMTVGNSPYSLVYDSGKSEVFVANFLDGTVSVIPDSSVTATSPSPTASPSPLPSPTSSPSPISTASTSPTPKKTGTPATTENSSVANLAISGNITTSQMSNVTITINSSATTTLSFILTGESGTTGFSNITIPKSAVSYGTSPLVSINGSLASNQGYTQDNSNYYVWYTTHFSTHQVSIVFASNTSTNPATSSSGLQNTALRLDWVELTILMAMAIIVAVVAVAAFLLLSKRKGAEQMEPA